MARFLIELLVPLFFVSGALSTSSYPPPDCATAAAAATSGNAGAAAIASCQPPPPILPCGPYEEWTDCLPCGPDTCKPDGKDHICPAYCRSGCKCMEGYCRNPDNKCVPKKTCRPYEEWTDCLPCEPDTCKPDGKDHICPAYCRSGCKCMEGYCKSQDNKCVPKNNCTPTKKCGKNEEWDCRKTCDKDTCASILAKYACEKDAWTCGCFCERGLYREKPGSPCQSMCKCSNMWHNPDCNKGIGSDSVPVDSDDTSK